MLHTIVLRLQHTISSLALRRPRSVLFQFFLELFPIAGKLFELHLRRNTNVCGVFALMKADVEFKGAENPAKTGLLRNAQYSAPYQGLGIKITCIVYSTPLRGQTIHSTRQLQMSLTAGVCFYVQSTWGNLRGSRSNALTLQYSQLSIGSSARESLCMSRLLPHV